MYKSKTHYHITVDDLDVIVGALDGYLEISDLPDFHRGITRKFAAITISQTFAFAIVDTFLILYLLEFLNFTQLGIVLATRFAITSILDFPTGALGDHIGYGRVLRVAYLFLGLGAFVLVLAGNLIWFILAYASIAIGQSQLSGALESWLDNQYKDDIIDHDKKIFGSFKGRLRGLETIIRAIAILGGGIIAQISSRRILIAVHLGMVLLTLFLIIRLIPTSDIGEVNVFSQVKGETWNKMQTSLSWIKEQPAIMFLFLGLGIVYGVGGGVWYNQILFPLYFMYSKSDFNTGVIRAANFVIGFIWVLFVPAISKRVKDEGMPMLLSQLYADSLFFFLVWLYFIFFPPANSFVLLTFLGVILLFQIVGIGDVLSEVFFSRIMIKHVPNDIRNSIYSLFSTIVTLLSIPFALLGGLVLDQLGFATGIIFVSISSFVGILVMGYGLIIKGLDDQSDDT